MLGTTPQSISLLTPVLPSSSKFVGETAQSVHAAKEAARLIGWTVEWVVVIDGAGEIPPIPEADKIVKIERTRGVSVARTYALTEAEGEWIAPLDADDLLDLDGFIALLKSLTENSSVPWVAANRLLMDGHKTPHWKEEAESWDAGALAESWTVPFCFHPNSILAKRDLALQIRGWPSVPTNEDLAFVLNLSEISAGRFVPAVLTRYRMWENQSIADPAYASLKKCAFGMIAKTMNARRQKEGLAPLTPPPSGNAFSHLHKK